MYNVQNHHGDSGWTQSGGVFTGGNTQMSLTKLNLSGGLFTSTSGTLKLGKLNSCTLLNLMTVSSGSYFQANSGTIELIHTRGSASSCHSTGQLTLSSDLQINNFKITGDVPGGGWYSKYESTNSNRLNINGNLTFAGGQSNLKFDLKGNLIIQANTSCQDNFEVQMMGDQNQNYTYSAGCSPQLIVNKASGTVTPASTTTAHFMGVQLLQGSFQAPSTALNLGIQTCVSYNVLKVVSGATFDFNNTAITLSGGRGSMSSCNSTNTFDLPSGYQIPNLTATSATAGGGWHSIIGATNPFVVVGNLSITGYRNNANISLYGNYNAASTVDYGTGTLTFVGNNSQTITFGAGGAHSTGNITLSKNGGSVSLNSNFTLNGASQILTINNGNLFNMNGYSLTVPYRIQNDGTLQTGSSGVCGTLTVGTLLGNTAICP